MEGIDKCRGTLRIGTDSMEHHRISSESDMVGMMMCGDLSDEAVGRILEMIQSSRSDIC